MAAVAGEMEKTKRYGTAVGRLVFETCGRLGGEGTKFAARLCDNGGGEWAVQPACSWTMEDPQKGHISKDVVDHSLSS